MDPISFFYPRPLLLNLLSIYFHLHIVTNFPRGRDRDFVYANFRGLIAEDMLRKMSDALGAGKNTALRTLFSLEI